MRRILHLLAFEYRHHWRWVPVWVGVFCLDLLFHLALPIGGEGSFQGRRLSFWTPPPPVLLGLFLGLSLPRLRPLGPRTFWRTRPVGSGEVLGVVLLFVASAFFLPELLLECAGLRFYGATSGALPGLLLEAFSWQILVLGLVLAVCSLVRDLWHALVVTFLVALVAGVQLLVAAQSLGAEHFSWFSLGSTDGPLGVALGYGLGALLLAAVWLLFRTRRLRGPIALLGAAVLFLGGVDPQPVDNALRGALAGGGGVSEPKLRLSHARLRTEDPGHSGSEAPIPIEGEIEVLGLEAGRFADVRFGAGSLELPGGRPLSLLGSSEILWLGRREALGHALGGVKVEPERVTNPLRRTILTADAAEVDRLSEGYGILKAEATVSLVAPVQRLAVPLVAGDEAEADGWSLRVERVEVAPPQVWVGFRQRRLVSGLRELPEVSSIPGLEYLLVHRRDGRAFLASPGSSFSPSHLGRPASQPAGNALVAPGRSRDRGAILTARPRVEAGVESLTFWLPGDAIGEAWLADAELVLVQNRLLGRRRSSLGVEDLGIERGEEP